MRKNRLTKTTIYLIDGAKYVFSRVSSSAETRRKIFRRNPLNLGMKANSILAIVIILMMLFSVFAWLSAGFQSGPNVQPIRNDATDRPSSPSPHASNQTQPKASSNPSDFTQIIGRLAVSVSDAIVPAKLCLIESSMNDTAMWTAVAANAWNFYQPGVGVNSATGLPAGNYGWNYFTDWDLGVYIQAVIDAERIGLINKTGTWGSSARLEKVMDFLETRELNSTTKVPYWFYGWDRTGYLNQSSVDLVDTGTLFVALYNLKTYNSSLVNRIENFVYNRVNSSMPHNSNNRTDYDSFVPSFAGSPSIYAYYYSSGFALFWPAQLGGVPNQILNTMYAASVKTPENVTLPKADISCEPLLYSFFNLPTNPRIVNLMNSTYSAHEAKFNASGQYVAFSEGLTQNDYIWEWVVMSNNSTWKITTNGGLESQIKPIIYNKVAISFLALYNTTFSRNMCIYLEKVLPTPTKGYYSGADFSNESYYVNTVPYVDCNTNGLILSAANYALHT